MEITDVLKILADKSDLNIVVSKEVRGKTSIFLKDIDIEDGLRIILETNNLAYEKEGNLVKVMTRIEYETLYGRKPFERRKIRTIETEHIEAKSLLPVLNGLKSNEGKIFVEERSNKLILFDLPEVITQMEEIVSSLDSPSITRVFNLKNVEPDKIKPKLQPLLSKEGKFEIDPLTKKIIITDTLKRVEEIGKLISQWDEKPKLVTKVWTLNYASSKEVGEKIKDGLTKEIGNLKFDERGKKIIIIDFEEVVERMENLISAYDQPTKEVLIEAKIIQVTLVKGNKLGINWEVLAKDVDNLAVKGIFNVLANTDPGGRLEVGVLTSNDYHVLLEALGTVGKTDLLSTPRLTRN